MLNCYFKYLGRKYSSYKDCAFSRSCIILSDCEALDKLFNYVARYFVRFIKHIDFNEDYTSVVVSDNEFTFCIAGEVLNSCWDIAEEGKVITVDGKQFPEIVAVIHWVDVKDLRLIGFEAEDVGVIGGEWETETVKNLDKAMVDFVVLELGLGVLKSRGFQIRQIYLN